MFCVTGYKKKPAESGLVEVPSGIEPLYTVLQTVA